VPNCRQIADERVSEGENTGLSVTVRTSKAGLRDGYVAQSQKAASRNLSKWNNNTFSR
jgi:hypothetical protein